MNKIDGVMERLKLISTKDKVTVKDFVLLKSELFLGPDATLELELNWDYIFEESIDSTGVKWYEKSLKSYFRSKNKIGCPMQISDLVFKLALGIPEDVIKQVERSRKKAEYLAQVKIKDKRNPYYRDAKAKASTYVSTSIKRANDIFVEMLKSDPDYAGLLKLLKPKFDEFWSSPMPEDEASKRRHFLRMWKEFTQSKDHPSSE